jgi:hypothetical protein
MYLRMTTGSNWGGIEVKSKRAAETAPVTPRQFIKTWQESSTVAEVAAKVRRKKNACRVRAFRYRKLGVPLKEFPPVIIEPSDWSELAEYAQSLLEQRKANGTGEQPS